MPYPLKKLSEVGEIITGFTPSKNNADFWGGETLFVKPPHLGKGNIVTATEETLSDLGKQKGKLVKKNSIMVCCIGSLGKVGIAGEDLCTNQQINSIYFDDKIVDFKYAYYYAITLEETMKQMANQAIIAKLIKTNFSKIQIPLPPLPTQKAIVQKLNEAFACIDASIELAEKSLKAIEEGNASVLEEVFGNGEYEEKSLGEIISMNYGKGVDKQDKNENGLFEVYGANGVMYFSNKFLYDGESIIIGRKGSAGALKRVSGKFWASDVTYYVTLRKNDNLDYVFNGLKFLNLPSLAQGVKPGINRNHVYELKLPLPLLSKQKEIVEYLDRVFAVNAELKRAYEEKIQSLKELKQSLLREAFEGRLVRE